ncbi:MAG: tRNA (guanosine(37)-N1)-methyltransferase TrmD [Clostridia bacterium]|nr:tRNA (guanosine(37)-N1)-methyltransferase TrmD [Clostridia bacterium]NCC74964.1 tRNA (guanosine(37)-N1)-methyltransferase TrmD [Clostridia bacterium]
MRFSVLTLFPELVESIAQTSITGRALKNGHIELQTIQIRDFAINAYGQVDDALYGGGTGMLLRPEPVYAAWLQATGQTGQPEVVHHPEKVRTIFLSPKGRVLNQAMVEELTTCQHLILICGHYEGIDQRVLDVLVDEEVSIGDYVLTGGEIAAAVLIDAVSRLVPGVLPDQSAHELESHSLGRLEHPQYTRPSSWQGLKVPEVLLSGHQARIDRFQYLSSLKDTLVKRPDLFNQLQLSAGEYQELIEYTCQDPDPLL